MPKIRKGGVQKLGAGQLGARKRGGGLWSSAKKFAEKKAKELAVKVIAPQVVAQAKKTGVKLNTGKVKSYLMGLSKAKLMAYKKKPLSIVPQIVAALA